MKKAIIILFRKSEKSDYLNPLIYRPIALLNTLKKTFKTVVARRIRYAVKAYRFFFEDLDGSTEREINENGVISLYRKGLYNLGRK
jgi:hypothetical protein